MTEERTSGLIQRIATLPLWVRVASLAVLAPWPRSDPDAFEPTVSQIGDELLGGAPPLP